MKQTLAVMTVVMVTVPAVAREFNDIGEWRREMRERRVEEAASKPVEVPAVPRDSHGCAALRLDDVVISRGVFSTDFTVEKDGVEIGQVEVARDGFTIKSGDAVSARVSGGRVTDCSGTLIGTVEEIASDDASTFAVKDANGVIVAASGSVDSHSMVLRGAGGMISVQNDHWLKDSYRVTSSGIDARLAAVVTLMNNKALYRRAQQRRRDNPHEPRGGRDR